jgi:probable LLM family oxidoreductase
MELGIYTFVDLAENPETGDKISPLQRYRNLMEEVELADQLGLDVFGIGEHHRPDLIASAPVVALAAAAQRSKNIRLSSAVTVLSSDDPVRVFQSFATLDLLSAGRAEIMAGRGSFIESFPLFGYDLQDYNELFSEKIELLLELREKEYITWQGKYRASLNNQGVFPRPVQDKLPIWIAVGGTPQSVVRAATLKLPMAIAIIGGMPEQYVSFAQLYRQISKEAGNTKSPLPLSINSPTYIADDSQQAADEYWPHYHTVFSKIGKERGWPPNSRAQFEASRSPKASLLVGSPQQVIDKILYEYELFGHTRFLAQMSLGGLPHEKLMHSIELFGTKVAPAIRREIVKQD